MNAQREIIYGQRQKVLAGEDVSASVRGMMKESIEANAKLFLAGETPDDWDFAGLRQHYLGWLAKPDDFQYSADELNRLTPQDVTDVLVKRAEAVCADKEKRWGS